MVGRATLLSPFCSVWIHTGPLRRRQRKPPMSRRIAAAGVALAALLFVSFPSAVFAATGGPARTVAPSHRRAADDATQTLGAATFYGRSSPLATAAAPARARSPLTPRGPSIAPGCAPPPSTTLGRHPPNATLQPP